MWKSLTAGSKRPKTMRPFEPWTFAPAGKAAMAMMPTKNAIVNSPVTVRLMKEACCVVISILLVFTRHQDELLLPLRSVFCRCFVLSEQDIPRENPQETKKEEDTTSARYRTVHFGKDR